MEKDYWKEYLDKLRVEEAKELVGDAPKPKDNLKDALKSVSGTSKMSPFNVFRYSLTMLLLSVKMGLFAYLPVNPLINLSWFWVFFPAICVDLFFILIVIITLIIVMGIYGFTGLLSVYDKIMLWRTNRALKRSKQLRDDVYEN